jgi:uncharacterized protein
MGKIEETGRVNNFRRAAQVLQGHPPAGRVHSRRQALMAIPYYGWANRGPGEMTVWIANAEKAIRPQPAPTLASESRVTTSSGRGVRAVNDLASPASSYDGSEGYFHCWPHKGTTEWVEYAFATATRISRASLYWYDDTGHGECRIPAGWRVLYRDSDTWRRVDAEAYQVAKDRANAARFSPVTTTAVRLEITLQPTWSAGIIEFDVR